MAVGRATVGVSHIPQNLSEKIKYRKGLATKLLPCRFSHNSVQYGKTKMYEALLLDAGGTLLETAEPVAETYANIGRKYGLKSSVAEIKLGFKKVFSEPWPEKLRYQGDGRPFWRHVVAKATNCSSVEYFEEVYKHYSQGSAWKLPNGSYEALKDLRSSGVKLAVVSNFDNRLRPILEEKNMADLFNAIIISSEVGYEKPDPEIFQLALGQLGITASKAVHIGNDPKNDKMGANAIGIDSWLWGKEIHTFQEILDRIISFRKN